MTQKDMLDPVIVCTVEAMKLKLDKRLSEEDFHYQYDGEYFADVDECPERKEIMSQQGWN
jgi:hypothetical protein